MKNTSLDWGGVGKYFSQEVTFKLMREGTGGPRSQEKGLCVGGGAALQPRE